MTTHLNAEVNDRLQEVNEIDNGCTVAMASPLKRSNKTDGGISNKRLKTANRIFSRLSGDCGAKSGDISLR